jgi:hypothetical protein
MAKYTIDQLDDSYFLYRVPVAPISDAETMRLRDNFSDMLLSCYAEITSLIHSVSIYVMAREELNKSWTPVAIPNEFIDMKDALDKLYGREPLPCQADDCRCCKFWRSSPPKPVDVTY